MICLRDNGQPIGAINFTDIDTKNLKTETGSCWERNPHGGRD
jgi:RimJ/RimL family protein N-acetyltransferase